MWLCVDSPLQQSTCAAAMFLTLLSVPPDQPFFCNLFFLIRIVTILMEPTVTRSLRTTERVVKINEWLTRCNTECTTCRPKGSEQRGALPKRLIDVSNGNPHLIEIEAKKLSLPVEYAALSYVWGKDPTEFKTTKDNLETHMKRGLPMELAGKTLQDVFELIRNLQLQYLWIDAICIVQKTKGDTDDDGEWRQEANKMGDIYSNAYLVISALASRDVKSGLYQERKISDPTENQRYHETMTSCRMMPQEAWDDHVKGAFPLLYRAWAFQERVLSRRIVHFTQIGLIWECMEYRSCECELSKDFSGQPNRMSQAVRQCVDTLDAQQALRLWHECVQSYSKRALTCQKDRGVAIEGVARLIRGPEKFNDTYYGGLWKDGLPLDLLWYCDQTSTIRNRIAGEPSWSWVSIDCGIEWLKETKSIPNKPRDLMRAMYFELLRDENCTTGSTMNLAEYVSVTASEIILKTKVTTAKLDDPPKEQKSKNAQLTFWTVKVGEGRALKFYPDFLAPDTDKEYRYVQILGIENNLGIWDAGLIVESTDDQADRRIGVAWSPSCSSESSSSTCLAGGKSSSTCFTKDKKKIHPIRLV
jgi:hypothetical protein